MGRCWRFSSLCLGRCTMGRRCVAVLLLVAGLGMVGYATGDAYVYGQASAFNNTCCVRQSRVPPQGGVCTTTGKGDDKNINCLDAGGCSEAFQDIFIAATCRPQGFQNCTILPTTGSGSGS